MNTIMVSVAMMYLILLEPFLAIKLNQVSSPSPPSSQKEDRRLHMEYRDPKLTKLYLFTKKSARDGRSLSVFQPESFENFDPHLETKVIIHGFMDQVRIADWMHSMKDEFLQHGDYNIIVVDWSSANSVPYSRAAANTERVGEEIADLLKFLRDRMGGKPETFHLIGHSLGSHVAGFVGERIKPIGRITGLDPAMYHFKDSPPRQRLDTSDALFVDVIHTDAGGIGMVKPVGHIDFYPNGGSIQPGCTAVNYLTSLIQKGVVESVRSLICSHMRAITLFTESINSRGCQFMATRCQSWKDYEDGRCGDCGYNGQNCAVMGYQTDTTRYYGNQSYFLVTMGQPPHCVFEYRLKLFEAGEESGMVLPRLLMPAWRAREALSTRNFFITLTGSLSQAEILLEERNEVDRHIYVVNSPTDLGAVDGAFLKWKPKPVGAVVNVITTVLSQQQSSMPLVTRIDVVAMNSLSPYGNKFTLCASPSSLDSQSLVVGLRSMFC